MHLYIKSQDTRMWRVVIDGDYILMVAQDDGTQVEKTEEAWTSAGEERVILNAKTYLIF
jgi:hypothetical protein